jgi:hypothetical protein
MISTSTWPASIACARSRSEAAWSIELISTVGA